MKANVPKKHKRFIVGEEGTFFATVTGGEGDKCHYPTRLDTYGCGCAHDCKYCFNPNKDDCCNLRFKEKNENE